jgi:hypothetical protein
MIWIIIGILIFVLSAIFLLHYKEKYGPVPLYTHIPSNINPYSGYIRYSESMLQDMCPNNKRLKSCQTKNDCGQAEYCLSMGEGYFCQCAIANDCIEEAVC